MSRPSAAILAGGRATRFNGRDKSGLMVDGRTILERQIDTLAPLAGEVLIVGAPHVVPSRPEIRAVADIVPGSGPLGGIHAALTEARAEVVFVAACDMPFLTGPFVEYLCSLADTAPIVVPRTEERLHPLCAVYSRACLDVAARLLAERRLAMRALLSAVPTREVTEMEMSRFGTPSRLLANVNTPAEYANLEALQDHRR
jgi:molybdopterin-guanine dinucleotide biosynthesis protein A